MERRDAVEPRGDDELLDEQQIIELPDRLNMSIISTNMGLPVNNILTGSAGTQGAAQAPGAQDAPVDQVEP